MKNKKTDDANRNRGLAQKLKCFQQGKAYDIETIKDLYMYADCKNKQWKKEYEHKMDKYNELLSKNKAVVEWKPVQKSIDMSIFDDYLPEIQDQIVWGEAS